MTEGECSRHQQQVNPFPYVTPPGNLVGAQVDRIRNKRIHPVVAILGWAGHPCSPDFADADVGVTYQTPL